MAQGSQRKPSRVNNTKSILSVNSITTKESATPNVGKWRWQSLSQRLSRPFHSQDWLADVSILSHSLREIYYGIAALSQKRKTSIQVIFTQSSVSMTTTSEYLPVSGFNVPSLHLSQSLRLHSFQVSINKLQQSEQQKSFLTCLWQSVTVQVPIQTKHEHKLTIKVSVSFQVSSNSFHFLHSPGRLQWLNTCSNQTHPQLPLKTTNATWCIWESKPTFPNRLCLPVLSLSVRCQPTTSTPSSTVPSVPWRFLLFSLSLSTPVPKLPGQPNCLKLQFQGHQCKRPSSRAPLFLHITEPQVFNYSRLISIPHSHPTHVRIQFFHEPRSLPKHSLTLQVPTFLYPSPGMTPSSVAPRTVHSVRPGSTTTWPTCRDVSISHGTFLQRFQWFSRLSLPKSPSFLVTLQALITKVTRLLHTKMQISHATQLQHNTQLSRWNLFYPHSPLL